MPSTENALPDDIDALKAMVLSHAALIAQREAQIKARDAQVTELKAKLDSREAEIEHLKLLIAKLRRMQFGRKSEKLDRQIEQLELRLEELQTEQGSAAAAADQKPGRDTPREKRAQQPLPDHLEREERVYQPGQESCPKCAGALKPLGEDVAEQLEYVRAHFRVIRHRRLKLACSCCDCIVQAAAPSRPIERGLPGPGLLAHIAAMKFMYHVPLYRQAMRFAHDGVAIDAGTMGDWIGQISWLLRPLVEAVHRYVLAAGKVHADDTPLPVLAPGVGRTKTARLPPASH